MKSRRRVNSTLCFFRFNIFGDCCERNTTISRKVNLIAAALFWGFFAATPHVAQTPLAGQWQGMLLREGSEAKVSVNFKPTPAGIEGTMTMLTVGMFRQPLSKITVNLPQLHFEQSNLDAIFEEEVHFRNREVTLAGTLTLPLTRGKHPAIVFTHGGGPDTRDLSRFYADHFA